MKARKTTDPVHPPTPAAARDAGRDQRDRPAAPAHDDHTGVLHLQTTAGNRAVSAVLGGDRPVQRIPVTVPSRRETVFNKGQPDGRSTSRSYGGTAGVKLDMSRGGTPEVVTVTVRIRFLSQDRDVNGKDTGTASLIPPGDERRAWAQDMCRKAPGLWTGRAKLVGRREPTERYSWDGVMHPDRGGPVTLPLVFKAVPVFEAASPSAPADTTVKVFGSATTAGGDQHPIDAGHYYMTKGPTYPYPAEAIYAHEYGHLLGLSDEYSHSNPQMHALLHGIDPATSAARGTALDTETTRRMVVAALTRPLHDRLHAAGREISAVLRRGAGPMRRALAGQLRTTLADPGIRTLFEVNLPPAAAALAPRVPAAVAAATSARHNTTGVAAEAVAGQLAPKALGALLDSRYIAALDAVQGALDLGGGLGMNIDIGGWAGVRADGVAAVPPSGLWAAASSGASATEAGRVVRHTVGAAAQRGKAPPVRPATSLIGQLEALPRAWSAFTTAAPAALSSGRLETDLASALGSAWLARLGTVAPAGPATAAQLAAAADTAVHSATRTAATNAVKAYLASAVEPILRASVAGLTSAVDTEVAAVMSTPAGALAAAAPKDPALAALATTLHKQLTDEAAAATAAQAATPGSTPVDPGKGAPAQSVTYGTVNMMSDNTAVFRTDQFADLAAQFNDPAHHLRKEREGMFTVDKP